MAWGISPKEIKSLSLEGYSATNYLTLLYHAMDSLGWHISYFNHDGIIAYTDISWPSYSEEVSARIIANKIVIKSECVGYQGFFTDYGKNTENLDLLFGEIDVRQVILSDTLDATAQQLMDSIPDNQFVQLSDPPLAGKEKLKTFWDCFVPQHKYFVTPILVLTNIALFVITKIAFTIILVAAIKSRYFLHHIENPVEQAYLLLGFNNRSAVLHGQYWRLLSSIFLHFNLLHIVGNMIVLIYIGSMIESKLGRLNFLCIYMCAGVAASTISIIWSATIVGAGASGAVFGLFGVLLALLSTDFYERNARKAILISTGLFVGYSILPLGKHIDHAAHFGGLLAGYFLGWIAYLDMKNKKTNVTWLTSLASVILTGIFVLICLSFTPDYKVKEYNLMMRHARQENGYIAHDFYNYEDSTHDQKLRTIEQYGLPKLAKYKQLADSISSLPLPSKIKSKALCQSKIIKMQCTYFNYLYLELKENSKKYRPAIVAVTDSINKLRVEIGKLE